MTKAEWAAIAEALGKRRKVIDESWPPKGGYNSAAGDAHDRKLIRGAKLEALDETARAVCAVLKSHSTRFDGARFLRIVGVDRKRR